MNAVGTLVCPILVGRDDLLELASRRLEGGLAGRGHLLFLAGEAGVGKTRLLGSIERRAVALGYRAVRGGTYPGDLEVAAAVFIDLARAMQRDERLAALGERLSRRLTDADDSAGGGDAHRRRRVLTLDVAAMLAEAAAVGPVLISLEDLHQADDLTLEIVASLTRLLPEVPLVVIGTYRSDELYPRLPMRDWRTRLLGQRLAEEARVRRLSVEETATMTTLLFGTALPTPRDVAETVHARTDGIPLHVEELIALLRVTGGTPVLTSPVPEVPETVEAAILARIEHRTRRARELARIGAVIGRSFEFDLLAGVVGDDPERLARPLTELAEHFFLSPSAASGRYGFRHAVICDAIYAQIPPPTRQRLHGEVADVAAARGDFSDAFLSSHYERAGRRDDAFATALRAARAAEAISARREAFDLYARAIRNVPPGLSPSERSELFERHARAAAAVDDNATAADWFERARVEYAAAGRPVDAAAVVAPLVASRHLLGDDLAARESRLTEALAELDALAPGTAVDVARARLLAGLASANMLDRRLDAAIAHGEHARRVAGGAVDAAAERNATVTLGACLVFAGRMDEGWARLEESIATTRAARLEAEAARAYRMIGSCASVLVEYERAERSLREGIEYAERVELWNDRHYMAAHLAHVLWATGRWPEATSVAEHALADGRGGITTRITALHVLGYVALGRGKWAEADAALEEARVAGERMHELQRLSPALWGLAEAAVLRGDPAAAVDWSERGRVASAAVDDAAYLFPFLVTGTRARLALGDVAAAERWIHLLEAPLRLRSIPGTLPALDHARGLVLLASGSTGRARDALTAAADAWQERGRAWEGAWARLDLARSDVRANRYAQAATLAAAVDRFATEVGSEPLAQRAAELARVGRGRGVEEEAWSPLTAREFAVARLVAEGLTNAAIGARLGVAPKTVAAHVEHILAKLGASRRAEVGAWVGAVNARTPTGGALEGFRDGVGRAREAGASALRPPPPASRP